MSIVPNARDRKAQKDETCFQMLMTILLWKMSSIIRQLMNSQTNQENHIFCQNQIGQSNPTIVGPLTTHFNISIFSIVLKKY